MLKESKFKLPEQILFYASLVLSISMICMNSFNPSLDGPSHLYNAKLMADLLSGNTFIHAFYSLNKIPVPNSTDHFLLVLFYTIFSPATSLKILLTLCVAGFALSFRALIGLISPQNIGLSAFAIPLAHSFLFYIGFYNFCLSQFFMLWAIYYYLKHLHGTEIEYTIKRCLAIMLILLLIYFTNGLSFLIAGMVLVFLELQTLYQLWKLKQERTMVKRSLIFTSLWIPGILCFLIFTIKVPTFGSNPLQALSFHDLLKDIYHVRPLMVYGDNEIPFARGFFYVLASLCLSSFYLRFKNKSIPLFGKLPILLFTTMLMALLYFIVPNSASVGMMTVRLSFYLFLFGALWLFMQENHTPIKWLAIIAIYSLQWSLFFGKHLPSIQGMDDKAKEIAASSKYIKANSIVLPVDCTGNWIMPHFIDYAGLDKPIINPYNYEPVVGWFPLVLNYAQPSIEFFAQVNDIAATLWWGKPDLPTSHQIDYIFVLGDISRIRTESDYSSLKNNIVNKCSLTYASADSSIHIYAVNHKPI